MGINEKEWEKKKVVNAKHSRKVNADSPNLLLSPDTADLAEYPVAINQSGKLFAESELG